MKDHSGASDNEGAGPNNKPQIFPESRPAIAHGQCDHQNNRGTRGEKEGNVFRAIAELIDGMREENIEGQKSDIQNREDLNPYHPAGPPALIQLYHAPSSIRPPWIEAQRTSAAWDSCRATARNRRLP